MCAESLIMASEEVKQGRAEAAAEKAKRKALRPWFKKKRYILPIAAVVLLFVGIAASGGSDTPGGDGASQQATAGEDEKAKVAKIGETVTSGSFEFTVKGIECGKTSVGDQFISEEAQGQYCMLDVTAKNVGDEAKYLNADSQYLYDDQDREFSADSMATTYVNPDSTTFFIEEINPGNGVSGKIAFDVPKDANIVSAKVGEGLFEGGVKVNLK